MRMEPEVSKSSRCSRLRGLLVGDFRMAQAQRGELVGVELPAVAEQVGPQVLDGL